MQSVPDLYQESFKKKLIRKLEHFKTRILNLQEKIIIGIDLKVYRGKNEFYSLDLSFRLN